jgi:hypothetical protein
MRSIEKETTQVNLFKEFQKGVLSFLIPSLKKQTINLGGPAKSGLGLLHGNLSSFFNPT